MDTSLAIFLLVFGYFTQEIYSECPIPPELQGDFYSLERGQDVITKISADELESQIDGSSSSLTCLDLEQGSSVVENGKVIGTNAKILFTNDQGSYICHEVILQNPNILQVKRSWFSSVSGTLEEVCGSISVSADSYTLFREYPEWVNCSSIFYGGYQFSYEMDLGGGGVCNSSGSTIQACVVPGTQYVDNELFEMRFAKCMDVDSSFALKLRLGCLGTWEDYNNGNIFSAVVDVSQTEYRTRFRCLLTRQDEWTKDRFTMSRWADCSTLRSPFEGPIRLGVTPVYSPNEGSCNFDVSGAIKKYDGATNSFTYTCFEDMVFADGEKMKHVSCNCAFAFTVANWGACKKEMGPVFLKQPSKTYFETLPVTLECLAEAHPPANYSWYLIRNDEEELITNGQDDPTSQFIIEDGKLEIYSDELADVGIFCIASNKFGSVLSSTATFVESYLNDFPLSARDPVTVDAYRGIGLECNPPVYGGYKRLAYAWYKDSVLNFIRPELDSDVYISSSGRLYFSKTAQDNNGNYHCVVSPVGSEPGSSKVSMPIPLQVRDAVPVTIAPQIASNFPLLVPEKPMVNENVTIECIAFGTGITTYTWNRIGDYLPRNVEYLHFGRTLVIYDVQLQDAGTYQCTVGDGSNEVSRQAVLQVEAASVPRFSTHLQDMISPVGSHINMSAIASGIPQVSYTWYKDAIELDVNDMEEDHKMRYTIAGNNLAIHRLDPKFDAGMYQLKASNEHGSAMTSAQLWIEEKTEPTVKPTEKPPQCNKDECYCQECNHCSCSSNGMLACTLMACQKPLPPVGDGSHRSCQWLSIKKITNWSTGEFSCSCECIYPSGASHLSGAILSLLIGLLMAFCVM